jgi:hypothetical protein
VQQADQVGPVSWSGCAMIQRRVQMLVVGVIFNFYGKGRNFKTRPKRRYIILSAEGLLAVGRRTPPLAARVYWPFQ